MDDLKIRRPVWWLGLAVALSVAVTACTTPADSPEPNDPMAAAAQPEVAKSLSDPREYKTIRLENGLDVLLVSDPSAEKSAAALSVGVGSMFNPRDFQGLAHYLEHMLHMGTQKFPEPGEYDVFMSENGGLKNAYTSLLITNYMFEVKSSAYQEGLDRFSDFFKAPLLNPEYSDKEKNAVNAEWLMRKDSDYIALWTLGRELHGEHPSNTFAVGNLETLGDKTDATTHATMLRFYDQYYSANIMKAVLLSNRSIDELATMAETYFSAIENKSIEAPEVTAEMDLGEAAGKLVHFVPKEDQRQLRIEFLIDNNGDQFKSKPNEYLGYIIGSEMPNTPAAVFKQLGWASSLGVDSSPDYFGNYGVFDITIELTEEGMKHREAMTDIVLGFIEKLRLDGVDDRYADEFATSLSNQFQFLEKIGDFSYVSQLAASLQVYPANHVIDAPYTFDGFNQAAVDDVLAQLTPERMRVWYISQDEPGDETLQYYGGRYSIEPLTVGSPEERLAKLDEFGLAMPALNTLLPESFELKHASAVPEKIIDDAGFEIWLQGSELYREQPKGFTQIYFNSGARQDDPLAAVMLSLWADLYQLGQAQLFNEAVVAGMTPSVSATNGLQMTVSGFTDKQPKLISQAVAALDIDFTEAELAQATDRYVRGIQNRKFEYPFRQAFPTLRRLTRTGNYSDATLLAAAADVDAAGLKAFVQSELSASRVRVYMFGNYSEADGNALKTTLEDLLSARDTDLYVRSDVYEPQPERKLVYQDDVPGENLAMLYMMPSTRTDFSARASAEVLSEHFQDRVFNQLRTEEQLGYAVFGIATELGEHPMMGFLIQTPVMNPAEMYQRFDAFRMEYKEILDEVTEAEFASLKEGILSNLTEPPKNLAAEAGPFISDWSQEKYEFDSKARLIAAVQDVTLAEAKAFYAETMLADDAQLLLVQLRGEAFAESPFAKVAGAEVVTDIAAFHEAMPVQPK